MQPSEKCVALVKKYEALKLQAYHDPSGMWAIGYGHAGAPAEEGKVISQEEADALLESDLKNIGYQLCPSIHVPVTQNMFDALCSLAYSVGTTALRGVWLMTYLNNGSYDQVAVEIPRWCRVNDEIVPGLIDRRLAEAALFRTPTGG